MGPRCHIARNQVTFQARWNNKTSQGKGHLSIIHASISFQLFKELIIRSQPEDIKDGISIKIFTVGCLYIYDIYVLNVKFRNMCAMEVSH